MYLIATVPIIRGFRGEGLTYFSATSYPKGAIVDIPLRGRDVPALVIGSSPAEQSKSQIRSASFATRKIEKRQKPLQLFRPEFISAAEKTAGFFATNVASVLETLTPSAILEIRKDISIPEPTEYTRETRTIEKLAFQADTEERFDRYRSIVREEFARGKSVYILVPTLQDAEYAFTNLSRGVGRYTILLHGSLSKKKQQTLWKEALATKHPLLVIGTSLFLSLPREDVGTIIIEREHARSFYTNRRPYLDIRITAEYVAQHLGARIVYSGIPLRVETLYRYQLHELDELTTLKTRVLAKAQTNIIDMRPRVEGTKKKEFVVLSEELREKIKNVSEGEGRMFIYAARRGLAPITVCEDCGNTVPCSQCHAGVVLHKGLRENVFVCHSCGATRSARERCQFCTSWKLTSLGVGVERVEEALKKHFPKFAPLSLDRDKASTHRQAKAVAEKFYGSIGEVLVGTEMALPYLTKNIEHIAVASLDSLLSLPDWNAHERVFALLMWLRTIATTTLAVQTRQPDASVLHQALSGNVADFYRNEIEERRNFGYPPFAVLIKFTVESTRTKLESEIRPLEKLFEKQKFLFYSPPLHIGRGRYIQRGLIRLPRQMWPEERLASKLRALPPNVTIEVAPEHLM